ncbi:MAG: diguanylate cyclase [Magnetococcales bacterium]|nr:diguanylate cyclase [Magnetococcales bacterium]
MAFLHWFHKSLTTKYFVTIFLMLTLATAALSVYYYRQLSEEIRTSRIKIVGTVADARHQALVQTLSSLRQQLAHFLARLDAGCTQYLPVWDEGCENWIALFVNTEPILSLSIVHHGKTIASHGAPVPDEALKNILANPKLLAHFQAYSASDLHRFHVAAFAPERDLALIVSFPLQIVASLFANRNGLGESGETFLASDTGMFITPARYPSHQGVSHPIAALPMQRCLNRENTEMLELDYRGAEIIHGFRFVPEIGGGCIMAHIDQKEAFAPLAALQGDMILIVVTLLLVSLLVSVMTARHITVPLRQLCLMANHIADGEFTHRIAAPGKDEVGQLGAMFNAMSDRLRVYSEDLEGLVRQRTAELERTTLRLREALTYQQTILNCANSTIIATTPAGLITLFNATAAAKLGYLASEVIGCQSPTIFHDPDELLRRTAKLRQAMGQIVEPGFEALIALARSGTTDENEWTYIRKDGSRFPVLLAFTPILDDQNGLIGFLGVGTDLTQRKQAEAQLQLSHQVIESTNEGILITTPDQIITYVNPAFERLTGWRREEAVGKPASLTKSGRHDSAFYAAMWHDLHAKGRWEGEIWDRRHNGELFPKWLSISAIKDATGVVLHYVGVFMDITRQKAAESQLRHLAYYDPLTGLANRCLFHERLKHEIATTRRYQQGLALFFIDLDRFKQVNDILGHDAGDELLQIVSQRITAKVREIDTIARLGGDEFTVIVTNVNREEQVFPIAQGIIATIGEPIPLKGEEVQVGASIGIALCPRDGDTCDSLIKHADMAMYLAKEKGRNQCQFYSADLSPRNHEGMQ